MKVPLKDLNPKWIEPGGQGVEFDCPCCVDGHRLYVWFLHPRDGGSAPTVSSARPKLYGHDGDLEDLSVYPAIDHSDCVIMVHDGSVVQGFV